MDDKKDDGLNPDSKEPTNNDGQSNVHNAPTGQPPVDDGDANKKPNDSDDDGIDENNLPNDSDELKKLIKKLRKENGTRRVMNKEFETKLTEFEIKEQNRIQEMKQKELDELANSQKFKELADIHLSENAELKKELDELKKEIKVYRQKENEIKKQLESERNDLLNQLPDDIREKYKDSNIHAIRDRLDLFNATKDNDSQHRTPNDEKPQNGQPPVQKSAWEINRDKLLSIK